MRSKENEFSEYLTAGLSPEGFIWRRRYLVGILLDLTDELGAPAALGGKDQFFDVYVDPTDGFYIESTGNRSSGVSIPANLETIQDAEE